MGTESHKRPTRLDQIIADLERQQELQRRRLEQTAETLRFWRAVKVKREPAGRAA